MFKECRIIARILVNVVLSTILYCTSLCHHCIEISNWNWNLC